MDGLLLTVTSERASWASLRRFGLAANVVNMADSSAQDSYKVKKSEVALLCFSRVGGQCTGLSVRGLLYISVVVLKKCSSEISVILRQKS